MHIMTHPLSIPTFIAMLLIVVSCSGQGAAEKLEPVVTKKSEPHRYSGWYCPDNFGFVPVDIQHLDEVPAISNRLPTEEELRDNKSLINVDTEKYPDARALEMEFPRVARIYDEGKGMSELIIVIQAIIVQEDTVVGYRYPNGGNGSAWLSDVTFLTKDEVAAMGPQPFFYSKSVLKASTADIWNAIREKTDYFKQLGIKFDKTGFFSAPYNPEFRARLHLDTDEEKATGYVGMVFGNYYLHIDYERDGFHYSEKLLFAENHEDGTTNLFFVSGPYPEDFEKHQSNWASWLEAVKQASETD